jgi:hypothetical protein
VNPAFHTCPVLPPAFVPFVGFCGKELKGEMNLQFADPFSLGRQRGERREERGAEAFVGVLVEVFIANLPPAVQSSERAGFRVRGDSRTPKSAPTDHYWTFDVRRWTLSVGR